MTTVEEIFFKKENEMQFSALRREIDSKIKENNKKQISIDTRIKSYVLGVVIPLIIGSAISVIFSSAYFAMGGFVCGIFIDGCFYLKYDNHDKMIKKKNDDLKSQIPRLIKSQEELLINSRNSKEKKTWRDAYYAATKGQSDPKRFCLKLPDSQSGLFWPPVEGAILIKYLDADTQLEHGARFEWKLPEGHKHF